MTRRFKRLLATALCLLPAAWAQPAPAPAPPPAATADSPGELDKLKRNCSEVARIGGCAETLFTGVPVHIAVGSIAPQNGFGAGAAYVGHYTPKNWRITWNADAIASNNASWRAGLYVKFIDSRVKSPTATFGVPKDKEIKEIKANLTELEEHPVIDFYAQTITLNKLFYYGLGADSSRSKESLFGERETIVGLSAVKPLGGKLHAGVYGEVNGRFVNLRSGSGQPTPLIQQVFTEATAPGLTTQPGFLQLAEGIRIRPVLFNDFLRMNYDFAYRQYFAPTDSIFNFQRITIDLSHQFAIYRETTRLLLAREVNGPDECAVDKDHPACPPIPKDREGSVNLRAFTALSMTPGGDVVPFYFMPTIGGSDINGNAALPSYADYRFRGPNLILFQERFEHSLWRPLGFAFELDQGTVALTRGGLSSSRWLHSYAAGLTLRAGGYPQVYLLFAWGGEGNHTIAQVNTSLLGGAARPPL